MFWKMKKSLYSINIDTVYTYTRIYIHNHTYYHIAFCFVIVAIASLSCLGRKNPVTMGMPFVMTLCIVPLLAREL